MDIVRKAMLLGFGVLSLTREKAEEVVDDLIKRGELATGDRFKVVDRLINESERHEEELRKKITGAVQKIVADLGLPTKKDLEGIGETLKRIEQKISSGEKREV